MTWLWSSFEEFEAHINPSYMNKNHFHGSYRDSLFENLKIIFKAIHELETVTESLHKLGYGEPSPSGESPPSMEERPLDGARALIMKGAYSGEMILLYHKRLAMSHWAQDFCHEKDLDEHWDRYQTQGNGLRIYRELDQFVLATDKLLEGFNRFLSEDTDFLIDLIELPKDLKSDFILARNLFSVGCDSIGALVTARGLEGVLRKIAEQKELKILHKGKELQADDGDFYDLIQVFYHAKWQKNKLRLIDKHTKSILELIRTMRNLTAHPDGTDQSYGNWRELAVVIARTADSLWKKSQVKRARLATKIIEKNW